MLRIAVLLVVGALIPRVAHGEAYDLPRVAMFIQNMVCSGVNTPDSTETFPANVCLWNFVSCRTSDVTQIDLSHRDCTGSVDLTNLPLYLEKLVLSGNRLSGNLTLTRLNPHIKYLYLDGNYFTGTPDLTRLQPTLRQLYLNNNSFSGNLDLSVLPLSINLAGLTLHNNPGLCGTSQVNDNCGKVTAPLQCTCFATVFGCPTCSPYIPPTQAPGNCLPQFASWPSYPGGVAGCSDLNTNCNIMWQNIQDAVNAAQCQCDDCTTYLSRWRLRQRYLAVRQACDTILSYYCSPTI